MTKKTAVTLCKAIGIPCKWNAEWQEFCVGKGNAIYHTDDPYDAVDTALAMAEYKRKAGQA